MMRIYLCRHGQTTGDVENRYGGDYEDHLTGLGIEESRKLAEVLSDKGIEGIFSSSLSRARETAGIISLATGNLLVEEIPELRERNWYGVITGMTKDKALAEFPDQVELLKDYKKILKDGESYEDFSQRVIKGLSKVCSAKHKCIVVVTHGGVFKNIFREILKEGEIKRVDDCGYAELKWDGDKLNLLSLSGIEVLS